MGQLNRMRNQRLTDHTLTTDECRDEWLDSQLVEGIRRRDEKALAALIDRYGGQVLAVSLRICSDELEASGVVTEVFWQFWCHADRYEPLRGSLCTYLLTMARSRSIDSRRSVACLDRQRSRLMEATVNIGYDKLSDGQPESRLLRDEYTHEVQQALEQLPELQRQVLQLAFFEGMSHQQVATMLQTPLGTVKTHIRKGLLRLRYLLTELSESGKPS